MDYLFLSDIVIFELGERDFSGSNDLNQSNMGN